MTTLLERSRAAREGIERARLASRVRQQISAIQQRVVEWSEHLQQHSTVLRQWRVLGEHVPDASAVAAADADAVVATLAAKAMLLLEGGADVQALSEDNLWARLVNAAEAANGAAAAALRAAWESRIEALGAVESPAALEQRMVGTPGAREALQRYRAQHAIYLRLVRQAPPTDPQVLDELAGCVAELREIHASIAIDAPEPVRAFFRALEQGGASLDQLTPEVLGWLHANDDTARFVIRMKAGGAWG